MRIFLVVITVFFMQHLSGMLPSTAHHERFYVDDGQPGEQLGAHFDRAVYCCCRPLSDGLVGRRQLDNCVLEVFGQGHDGDAAEYAVGEPLLRDSRNNLQRFFDAGDVALERVDRCWAFFLSRRGWEVWEDVFAQVRGDEMFEDDVQ